MDTEKAKKKRRKRRKRTKQSSEGALSPQLGGTGSPANTKEAKLSQGSHAPQDSAVSHSNNKSQSSSSRKRGRKRSRQDDPSTKQQKPQSRRAKAPQHCFQVDAADHCETPLEAYRDVVLLLDQIAVSLNKTRATLAIYDPYFCNGGVKVKLNSLGFHNVRNENKDFYKDIECNTIPNYDVLLTNPPYSGLHVENLLTFVAASGKPFLLLLPHYVYTKDYYQRALGSKVTPFYLVPKTRYAYVPPSWVENGITALSKGKVTTAPFPSFWYCRADNVDSNWLTQTYGASGVYRHSKRLHYASCTAHIPREMKGEFDATRKRPNARARKRAAKKRAAAMRGS